MSAAREDHFHRPAPELVPETVLAAMERDGWTPTQVRALIASYRRLARECDELRHPLHIMGRATPVMLQRLRGEPAQHIELDEGHERAASFALVERELRRVGVLNVEIRYWDMGASDTINMERIGGEWTHGNLLEAFQKIPLADRAREGA